MDEYFSFVQYVMGLEEMLSEAHHSQPLAEREPPAPHVLDLARPWRPSGRWIPRERPTRPERRQRRRGRRGEGCFPPRPSDLRCAGQSRPAFLALRSPRVPGKFRDPGPTGWPLQACLLVSLLVSWSQIQIHPKISGTSVPLNGGVDFVLTSPSH